jgi:uncharacterized protein YbjT (DUF2867 family)
MEGNGMRVLVLGGTGMVGSAVVRELHARGVEVEVLTRHPEKVAALPEGVRAVEGDLRSPATVRSVFRGADGVFLLNVVSPTEAQEGIMAVSGAMQAGVGRIVHLSVHNAGGAAYLPHFGSKVGVEAALAASGIPFTVLRPNNFFQNDYWYKDVILQRGIYPQPLGEAGLSRVDVRDIAEAAAVALTTDGHAGETYDLVGPEVVTGPSTAATWSEALGRDVRYGGHDMDAWERQSLQYMPDWMVYDFRLMYELFQTKGLRATPEAVARQIRLVGRPPRDFSSFARETAAAWLAGG